MSNYVKATDFAAKDALLSGNPAKIIKGTEIDTEFNSISTAIGTKADLASPTFTGTPSGPTASAATNTTQLATTAFVQTALSSAFTSGMIMMWSGSIATIPTGWVLCDGSNSTPDLRDRFVIGARQDDSGVAKTNVTGSLTQTGGSKDAIVVSHTHTFSATTNTTGAHTHAIQGYCKDGTTFNSPDLCGRGSPQPAVSTDSAGDHSHTVSGTTASSGSSGTNANLPPYYALAFIMKT